MHQILIDVDELRTISTLSVEAAQKMDEANTVIGGVVSEHDWKCPERVEIDESLEDIKKNVMELSDAFNGFATDITEAANAFTEIINSQIQMNTSYMEDVASLLSGFGSNFPVVGHSHGGNMANYTELMASSSLDTANISSLHGACDGISIMDFSQF